MKSFFKNFGSFFVLFLAAFFLWAAASPHLFMPTNAASNRPKVSDQTLINLSNACRNGSQIMCRGITRKSDSRAKKFTEVEIHGKKYNLTNYSENDIFLPMKSVHEWERVICAASQGDKIGIDCSDTSEFGGPSMGFPHSNGREAADPFGGKDLNTFEYQKSTGPSLGIKIDLIADWVVTQAQSCPSRNICGLPRQTFSGSVSCSTGDDADCDPNTKPATPTWSCGKTRNCTSGPYWFPNCPSYVGYDGGYIYGSCNYDSCTGNSIIKYCSAVTPTGQWIVTQAPSCPASCGNSSPTLYGSVSCSTGNDADCPSPKPSTPTRSCNTQPCPCGEDLYRLSGNCVAVGNGFYSPDNDDSRYNCTIKPAQNSIWTGSGGGSDNCPWGCKSGHSKNSSSTACVPDPVNCPANPPSNASWNGGHGDFEPNCDWSCNATFEKSGSSCLCPANTVQVGNSCEPIVNCQWSAWNWGSWSGCSKSCGTGNKTRIATRFEEVLAQNGGRACTGSSSKSETVSCNTQACPVACPANPPKENAVWLDGHGDFEPKCGWKCDEENDYVWNSALEECRATDNSCTNTPPDNASWLAGHGELKPNCSWRCDSGFSGNNCDPIPVESANPYYEFVCDSGAWTYAGRCSSLDSCDHTHDLGERCCTTNSSRPEGICRN